MINIVIIGEGNVGSHLASAFRMSRAQKRDVTVDVVNARTLKNLPSDADIYLICVNDDAIASVSDSLPIVNGIVAHTSGSIGIEALGRHHRRGVFYPLQTFTKGIELDYSEIPFFIEGSDSEVCSRLCDYAKLVSDAVRLAGSSDRALLHLAAVFACNFSNFLYTIADCIIKKGDMDFKLLLPLIRQSVEKVTHIAPQLAQTGPAVRGDFKVMQKQEIMLSSNPEYQEIYRLISKCILENQTQSKENC